ncbi:HER009Wp [Eremothecium sinecaudum]|uniref:HER009Wp n=1 Tax=Eremothecium sinecaudum TaxID=45286 RepID=A0A109V037_9SACH|nr:HER009Wp [Eremothecium sinecaudum]AMD21288.1 HER009Wp [Eremothecium sinecaudum]
MPKTKISSRNQYLLNKIIKELLKSLENQMVGLVEMLLEEFDDSPYGTEDGSEISSTKKDSPDIDDGDVGNEVLGYNNAIGIFHLRNVIFSFKMRYGTLAALDLDLIPQLLIEVSQIRNYFIHLIKCLSLYLELPTYSDKDKAKFISIFNLSSDVIFNMQLFPEIIDSLLEDASATGLIDSNIFEVGSNVINKVEKFQSSYQTFKAATNNNSSKCR